MQIILRDTFKSLAPFTSENLTDFAIITGKNGSGKSQLFELLGTELNKTIIIEPHVSVVKVGGIININTDILNREKWLAPIREIVNKFNEVSKKDLFDYVITNRIDPFPNDRFSLNTNFAFADALRTALGHKIGSLGIHATTPTSEMIGLFFPPNSQKMFEMALEICQNKQKAFSELIEADFYNHTIKDSSVDRNDLFDSKIEMVFYNYAKRREKNNYCFYKKSKGEENDSVSPEEFLTSNRPPWDIINEILTRHRIDFYFNPYEEDDYNPDANFKLKIVSNSTYTELDFEELSSGEQVIIGLILKMFTSEHYKENLSFPDLIILDEPDAHLHPEMSQLLIEVLHETFVEILKIKVLISTHSATTVALSPSDNIFKLTNGPTTSIKKISKDDALKLLTSFIPTLTIDYKNQRQIFAESYTDVNYYQTIYNKYISDNKPGTELYHDLYFMAYGTGKGNRGQVYKTVVELRERGNLTCFGLVDWDNKGPEIETEFVYIHGFEERYTVENFIFDPFYIYSLLLEKGRADGLEEISLRTVDELYLVKNETTDRLNSILEIFFNCIQKNCRFYKYQDLVDVKYHSDHVLKFPRWYLEEPAHTTVLDNLVKTFPGLAEGVFRNEGELQKELVRIAETFYPFVPKTTIEIINTLGVLK